MTIPEANLSDLCPVLNCTNEQPHAHRPGDPMRRGRDLWKREFIKYVAGVDDETIDRLGGLESEVKRCKHGEPVGSGCAACREHMTSLQVCRCETPEGNPCDGCGLPEREETSPSVTESSESSRTGRQLIPVDLGPYQRSRWIQEAGRLTDENRELRAQVEHMPDLMQSTYESWLSRHPCDERTQWHVQNFISDLRHAIGAPNE